MAKREVALLDEVQHFEDFGNQLPVARRDGLGPRFLVVIDLVLGIVRRHPHDPTPGPLHIGHIADGHRIHASDGRVERHAAEDLDSLCAVLANQLGEAGRLRPVVLENDGAHAPFFRELHDLEGVPLPLVGIGSVVRVQVDGPGQHRIRQLLIDGWIRLPSLVRLPVRLWGRLLRRYSPAYRCNHGHATHANQQSLRSHDGGSR